MKIMGIILLSLISFSVLAKDLNVYAIMSDKSIQNIEYLSSLLHNYGLESFYSKGRKVHTTLYLTSFSDEKREEIEKVLERYAQVAKTFQLSHNGLNRTKQNWLFLDIKSSRELQRLSDTMVFELSPLRDMSVTPPLWLKDYPQKYRAFELYGSPNVFQNFDPHLTLLAWAKSDLLDAFMANLSPDVLTNLFEMEVIGLGLAEVDEFGQIEKTLYEVPFIGKGPLEEKK